MLMQPQHLETARCRAACSAQDSQAGTCDQEAATGMTDGVEHLILRRHAHI